MRAAPVALAAAVVSALACTCSGSAPPPVAPGTPVDTGEILVGPADGKPGKGKAGKGKAGKNKGKRKADDGRGGRDDPGRSKRPDPALEPPDGLEYVGDGVWNVRRALVDRWVADPASLGADVEDAPDGVRVSGVGEGEDAWFLGLRNGDVLTTANGRSLADPRERLGLLPELERADEIVLGLVRRGDPATHRYVLVR